MNRAHYQSGVRLDQGRCFQFGVRRWRLSQLSKTKVKDLHVAIFAKHDVFRLDVSMHDSSSLGCRKCTGDLNGNIKSFVQGEWLFIHQLTQRLAFNKFRDDELGIIRDDELGTIEASDLVNRDDIGVIERRS